MLQRIVDKVGHQLREELRMPDHLHGRRAREGEFHAHLIRQRLVGPFKVGRVGVRLSKAPGTTRDLRVQIGDRTVLIPASAFPEPNNPHLGYAITWFGLALALAGVYVAWLTRRLFGRNERFL